jgi:hypothetical protein
MTIISTPPTSVACPDWCTDEPGHGYEWETKDGHDGRHHHRDFGDAEETVAAIVTEALYTGGRELNAGPWIEVWVHGCPIEALPVGDHDHMTAQEARLLGTRLLEAADELERIQSGQLGVQS